MSRIADNPMRTKHDEELEFLNALCIDLKIIILENGYLPVPRTDGDSIGMNRLEEFTRVIAKLSECKDQVRFR